MVSTDEIFKIIGTVGGSAISISLLPQVILTYKTKCTADISYTYQMIYIFGTALVNIYAIYFELWAVYVPCIIEFLLIVLLTFMKCIYDKRSNDSTILGKSMHSHFHSVISDMQKSTTFRTAHINERFNQRKNFAEETFHISIPRTDILVSDTQAMNAIDDIQKSLTVLCNLEIKSKENENVAGEILELTNKVQQELQSIKKRVESVDNSNDPEYGNGTKS